MLKCFGVLIVFFFLFSQTMHTPSNGGQNTKQPPLFPVIHMDINNLKQLPAFDEPIDQIRKRIHKFIGNQLENSPLHNRSPASLMKSNNIPLQTNPSNHRLPVANHAPVPGNIRPPAVINSASQFIPHHPDVQPQNRQQVNNAAQAVNHPVTRMPQFNNGPIFHPPMIMTPAMSGKNRVNQHLVIQTPPRQQPRPVPNQPSLVNIQSIPQTMNQIPYHAFQGQGHAMPMLGLNTIQNQPLLMFHRPILVNSIPQNVQFIQGPIANTRSLVRPTNLQAPTAQNNQISLPQIVFANGVLNQIAPAQNPAAVASKPNMLFSTVAKVDKPPQTMSKAGGSNTKKPIVPQVVVHQSGSSFKAPKVLVKKTNNLSSKTTNKSPAKQSRDSKTTPNKINLSTALKKNNALTSVNKSLVKLVLDKLKITTMDMLKGRLNNRVSGNAQSKGPSPRKTIVNTDTRISNSPIRLVGNTASNRAVLSGFPASLDPKRVSVSFKPSTGEKVISPKPTNIPRTIEIVHQNLNRTMPNNMTLEPFTATTHKKNGKMSITLTSKHTGNRPIVIEAATGNILVSHIKGPDGNAQFVIQHARETTTNPTSSTTPATTEEVEIEAEDIITTTSTTSSTSTTELPTTVPGSNIVTSTTPDHTTG